MTDRPWSWTAHMLLTGVLGSILVFNTPAPAPQKPHRAPTTLTLTGTP